MSLFDTVRPAGLQGVADYLFSPAVSIVQRVPRSQISRAHPAAAAGAYGERTSAVLSALSGDDETALSAAEAAGEHTSEPQEAVGGVGEAPGAAPIGGGGGGAGPSGAGAAPAPSQHLHQQLPALSLTAPVPRGRGGFELASSPPASTSPIYRANSVVSYTAGPPAGRHGAQQGQQVMGPPRRGAETPASAPAGVQLPGSSPNTSRGEVGGAPGAAAWNATTAALALELVHACSSLWCWLGCDCCPAGRL